MSVLPATRTIAAMLADPDACRYIAGDPRSDHPGLCGELRAVVSDLGGDKRLPYCEARARLCYQPRRRSARDGE